jgi:alpha-beta hydrolase superfamily lysophospholipase
MSRTLASFLAAAAAALALAALPAGRASAAAAAAAPATAPCPSGVPDSARCLTGRDEAGAFYWIAVPQAWNGVLVLHAHGGPELGAPRAERTAQDLSRWAVMVKAGYAWAGSSFRQGGVAVTAAAEDTERLRGIAIAVLGPPRVTILHGQSWGASVAAKGAELYPASYDGVLLSSGVLAGGTRSYDFRLDLRVVYQALCNNHPLPSEPPYPLWSGLPPDSTLTTAELARRVDDCTGLRLKPAERSSAQQRKLDTLLRVVRIPERSLLGHLNWATWDFQDIVYQRLGGGDPFGNAGVHYAGSADDEALNARVARYRADPAAVARFAADADLSGRIKAPVLSVHAIDDPVAFVELDSAFLATMQAAGTADHLVQTFTDEHEHSYLSDAEYPALMEALLAWIAAGEKPTPERVAARCAEILPRFGGACHFVPAYHPAPLATRVRPRNP